MGVLHFAVATIVGFWLYYFVVVFVGGFLAAVNIPSEYFRFFGREYSGVAHALLGTMLHAVPTALLIAAGVLAVERFWPKRPALAALPYFLGMVCFVIAWESSQATGCLPSQDNTSTCAQGILQSLPALPWWAWLQVASPWVGLGLAQWLLKRIRLAPARSVA